MIAIAVVAVLAAALLGRVLRGPDSESTPPLLRPRSDGGPPPIRAEKPLAEPLGELRNALLDPGRFGWPDADSTGVRDEAKLVDLGGMVDVTDSEVSVGGQEYPYPATGFVKVRDAVWISRDEVTIVGARMTRLRNRSSSVRLVGHDVAVIADRGSSGANYTVDTTQSEGSAFTELSRCTVDGGGVNVAVAWRAFRLTRCDISGGLDAVRLGDNTTVEESYLHDLSRVPGSHNDVFQVIAGSDIVVRRNTALAYTGGQPGDFARRDVGDPLNAVLGIGNVTGSVTDMTFEDNLVNGGNYSVFVNWSAVDDREPGAEIDRIRITGNRWGRDFRYGLWNGVRAPEVLRSGNVWDDSGRPADSSQPAGG